MREEKDACQQLLLVLLLLDGHTQPLKVLTRASQFCFQFSNFPVPLHIVGKHARILHFQLCTASLLLPKPSHQIGLFVGKERIS